MAWGNIAFGVTGLIIRFCDLLQSDGQSLCPTNMLRVAPRPKTQGGTITGLRVVKRR